MGGTKFCLLLSYNTLLYFILLSELMIANCSDIFDL